MKRAGWGTVCLLSLEFLALGVWPWNAFAEALVRATTAVQDNAALIGKVALPREVLVFSSVAFDRRDFARDRVIDDADFAIWGPDH